jgi:ABC-type glycerol-3-phosphate transport system substrate-binding protein
MRHLFRTAVGLGAAVAMLGVAACGSSSSTSSGSPSGGNGSAASSSGTKTISFVAAEYDTNTQPLWSKLITSFEAANPGYKVNLQVINWNDIDQKIKTMVQTNQAPDIVNLNHYADFAADSLLNPASSVLSSQVMSDFIPSFAAQAKVNGIQYGIPFIASDRLFFYNKTIFQQAGITSAPTTWQQVQSDAAAIKSKVPGVVPYGLPLGPEEAQAELMIWDEGNGGSYYSGGKWTINSAANVQTLDFLKSLTSQGLTEPNPGSTNRTDLFNEFAQGKVAMLNGAVFLPGLIQKQGNVQYGIAPIPVNAGHSAFTLGVEDFLMSFKHPGNTIAVQKFLDYFYSGAGGQNYANFLTTEGFLPVLASTGAKLPASLQPFIAALPKAQFYPSTQTAWPAVQGAIQQSIGTAFSGSSPASVLGQIQQTASSGGAS